MNKPNKEERGQMANAHYWETHPSVQLPIMPLVSPHNSSWLSWLHVIISWLFSL